MNRWSDCLRGLLLAAVLAAGPGAQSPGEPVADPAAPAAVGAVESSEARPLAVPVADDAAESGADAVEDSGPAQVGARQGGGRERSGGPEPARSGAGPDLELLDLLERYLWILPSTDGHRTTASAAALLVLTLLIGLATRMANIENRSLARVFVFAVVVLVMVLAELAVLPATPAWVVVVGAVDVVTWLIVGMAVFRTDLFQSLVMLVGLVMSGLVSVLLLQVAGVLLQARQMLG
jgi:hypothetical protein